MRVRIQLIAAALLLTLLPPLLPLMLPPSGDAAGGWTAFLGRFHPLLVHIPVTLVPLVWTFDIVAGRRVRSLQAAVLPLLILAATSAIAAFTVGILLARGEGTTGTLLSRHYWAASGVVSLTLLAAMLRVMALGASGREGTRWLAGSRATLTAALLLTVVTGHLGGQLTHGEAYLTEYAPWRQEHAEQLGPDSPVFDALVQPIFRENCTTCHGSSKVKGELRLDSFAALSKGGEHGPAVRAGDAEASELVRRVTLPRDHEEAMPADGRPPLTEEEVAVLRWWIASGASNQVTVAEVKDAPDAIARLLEDATQAEPARPLPLDEVARLARATGLVITPVSSDARDGLRVTAFSLPGGGVDAAVRQLTPLADLVREADLSHSDATDAAIATAATWTNLRALNLAFTKIRGRELGRLRALSTLHTLNLAGTSLDPGVIRHVTTLDSLAHLTLSGTPLADTDVNRVASALPDCTVVAGGDFLKQPSDDSVQPSEAQPSRR